MDRKLLLRIIPLFLSLFALVTCPAAVIQVSNTNDAGAGSFRQAVLDAASGDTITFSILTNLSTIVLTGGEVAVDKDLYIDGNGTALTTLSGDNANRILNISGNSDVIVNGVTFINGSTTTNGGAILTTSSQLELLNCSTLPGEALFWTM
ncbi:MAG: hypothetical protein ACPF9D_12570 [Owenweeksia sp.]